MVAIKAFTPEDVRSMGDARKHLAARSLWADEQGKAPTRLADEALEAARRAKKWGQRAAVAAVVAVGLLLLPLFMREHLYLVLAAVVSVGLMAVFFGASSRAEDAAQMFSRWGFGADYAILLSILQLSPEEAADISTEALYSSGLIALIDQKRRAAEAVGDSRPVDQFSNLTRSEQERRLFKWYGKVFARFGIRLEPELTQAPAARAVAA